MFESMDLIVIIIGMILLALVGSYMWKSKQKEQHDYDMNPPEIIDDYQM